MSRDELKEKITDILRHGYFRDPDDYISLSDGDADNIHLLVVSKKLMGKRFKEKRDLIWGDLILKLKPEEWGQISLVVAKTPDEVLAE